MHGDLGDGVGCYERGVGDIDGDHCGFYEVHCHKWSEIKLMSCRNKILYADIKEIVNFEMLSKKFLKITSV